MHCIHIWDNLFVCNFLLNNKIFVHFIEKCSSQSDRHKRKDKSFVAICKWAWKIPFNLTTNKIKTIIMQIFMLIWHIITDVTCALLVINSIFPCYCSIKLISWLPYFTLKKCNFACTQMVDKMMRFSVVFQQICYVVVVVWDIKPEMKKRFCF